MATHISDILIIGSGPAGYSCAIYAARANLKTHMVAGLQPGGQLTITSDVENYPGFAEAVQGPWLMEQMRLQTEHVGTEIFQDLIVDVDFSKRPFVARGDSGDEYIAQTVVIATGASARWLGLESEAKFQGYGVSACATCDGFFFRGKDVAVVGGGNSAVEEAIYLSQFTKSVTVIHRRDEFRAEKIMQDRLFQNEKIKVIWDSKVVEIVGTDEPRNVTGIKIENVKNGNVTTVPVDGVFVAIGHDPATKLFKGKVDIDPEGYVITNPDSTLTSVPGVYAAGDVKDKIFRQAITSAGMGCMAALEADKFLAMNGHAA